MTRIDMKNKYSSDIKKWDSLRKIVRNAIDEGLTQIRESNLSSTTSPDEIINHIKTFQNKYKLKVRYVGSFKLFDNGIDTALNNSTITSFYLNHHKNNDKITTILPIPELDSKPFDKLNELIEWCDDILQKDGFDDDLSLKLFRANCGHMMNVLLFEDYFNVDFRYGNAHKIMGGVVIPKNEEELFKLINAWANKDGEVRPIFFYANSIPIVRTIEDY